MDIRAPKLCKKARLRQFVSRFWPMTARPVDSPRQVQTILGNENQNEGETNFRKKPCSNERRAKYSKGRFHRARAHQSAEAHRWTKTSLRFHRLWIRLLRFGSGAPTCRECRCQRAA